MTTVTAPNLNTLPADLPVPKDDGAADHLVGLSLPAVSLPATTGPAINPATLRGIAVIYCYPMTGRPNVPLPEGWDAIPGARGCTPQSCAFRDHYSELQQLGAKVFGVSTQSTDYQREAAERLHLPFALLSDVDLNFANALRLPAFQVDGMQLIKRLTLIARDASIVKVFYPVFPSDRNAGDVVQWLKSHA
ncbi:MAG: peroxiredoxin [Gammaproteobacteria bacterium]